MSRAFIPGSFDPLHLGHLDVICSAQRLFGDVIVGVLYNREKSVGLFTPDERVQLILDAVATVDQQGVDVQRVTAHASSQLAVDAALDADADFIVKGLRTAADFEIEQQMAHTNLVVAGIQTVFVPCRPDHSFISSRFIREIAAQGRDVSRMVSAPIADALSDKFSTG